MWALLRELMVFVGFYGVAATAHYVAHRITGRFHEFEAHNVGAALFAAFAGHAGRDYAVHLVEVFAH